MTALAVHGAPSFAARRPVILGFLTLAVLVGGAFGWGAFTTIAGAVIAAGQVEVETRDQVVEHLDGGTVGEILVRDGNKVEAGQVLIRLVDIADASGEELAQPARGEHPYAGASSRLCGSARMSPDFRGEVDVAGVARPSCLRPCPGPMPTLRLGTM